MRPVAAIRSATLVIAVTLGAAGAAPSLARAQGQGAVDALQGERARLRAQLDKVNAEIDALKRAGGGVRDDYRLRARLADAESLARRLMDIEARLGIRAGASPKPQPPPTAEPTDGPADLDAKADILADQSRRVRAQAETFVRRAVDLKGRQELRRRAADLDRDPFAPMEGSKRRVASSSGAGAVTTAIPVRPDRLGQGSISDTNPVAPPSVPGATHTPAVTQTPGATQMPILNATLLPAQLRDLLDTATLTDIRRLETSGAGAVSPQALERAAAALRARADWLDGQSRAMRAKARAK
jgi:hypothetical protein